LLSLVIAPLPSSLADCFFLFSCRPFASGPCHHSALHCNAVCSVCGMCPPPITITALPVDCCFFCSLTPFAVVIIAASCHHHHFHHWLIVFVLNETFRCRHHSQVLPPLSSPLPVDFFGHFYSWTHFAVCHHSHVLPPLPLPPLVDCCFLAPCKLFNGHHHHIVPPPLLPLLVDCFFLAPGTDRCGIISTSYWHHHCHHRLIVFSC